MNTMPPSISVARTAVLVSSEILQGTGVTCKSAKLRYSCQTHDFRSHDDGSCSGSMERAHAMIDPSSVTALQRV